MSERHIHVRCKPKAIFINMHLCLPPLPESYSAVVKGARMVKVTYQDRQPPIISIKEAVAQRNFFPKKIDDLIVGDAESECSIYIVP